MTTITKPSGYAIHQGQVTALDSAVLPIFDRGALFGDMVFTTVVAFKLVPLNLRQHLTRLRAHAAQLRIEMPWSDAEFEFDIKTVLEYTNAAKCQVRIIISRGIGGTLLPPPGLKPEKYVTATSLDHTEAPLKEISLAIKHHPALARGEQIKTNSYHWTVRALIEAHTSGYHDIIWVNQDGEVTEAATANIFLLARQGDELEIITPPVQSGILNGTMRATVIKLLAQASIPVHEQIVLVDEIPRFDEAFLTSSIQGLRPIERIGRHKLHSTRPQATFNHIERLFGTWVESQIGYRVDWHNGKKSMR